jgi:hypothetical protein
MKQIAWKLNRLRAMGVAEIGHRVGDALRDRAQGMGLGLACTPPRARLDRFGRPWLATLPRTVDVVSHCVAADRILAGHFDVFSLHDRELGFPPDWNCDPKTGTHAPLAFGKRLDYRSEEVVGDIKYLWEPNRHLALTTLAQAYHLSGELRYAIGAQTLLESWFEQCPYPMGANWTSALELAIRLVNWSFTWHLLGGQGSILFQSPAGQQFLQRWLASIYQHCHFIAGYRSRYSSANNHLFGELLGLHVAALTWPCWKESAGWLRQTSIELEHEAVRQNGPDGVNREQAIYYQHEVADMMLICWLAGRANGVTPSVAFIARLEKMLVFIAAVMDVGGNISMIGDADDALLVDWSKESDWNLYRSLLATGAVLFDRPDFKAKAGRFDDKSCWLLGDAARLAFDHVSETELAPVTVAPQFPRAFEAGGYFILGRDLEQNNEVRLVADAGPLGYLSIAAHGHADALAFTLSLGGLACLIDPGTYAYHTHKKWRDYFRGTSAHNTVRVDGLDQSESGGNFLWLRKASARCESWDSSLDKDCLIASHDGYLRLHDPLLHRRKIEFIKDLGVIEIEDTLECESEHEIEFNWHFAPHCAVRIDQHRVSALCGGMRVEMTMPGSAYLPTLVTGSETPPLGWISRRFDEKAPSPSVQWREKIHGGCIRKTVLRIG